MANYREKWLYQKHCRLLPRLPCSFGPRGLLACKVMHCGPDGGLDPAMKAGFRHEAEQLARMR